VGIQNSGPVKAQLDDELGEALPDELDHFLAEVNSTPTFLRRHAFHIACALACLVLLAATRNYRMLGFAIGFANRPVAGWIVRSSDSLKTVRRVQKVSSLLSKAFVVYCVFVALSTLSR
jgi:hypothetical protein